MGKHLGGGCEYEVTHPSVTFHMPPGSEFVLHTDPDEVEGMRFTEGGAPEAATNPHNQP